MTSLPPEVIFDRYVKAHFPVGLNAGKLDIESLTSPTARQFLYLIQRKMNEGLRMENSNASGGIQHPPYHFDFLSADVVNACAFEDESYWFIGVTVPLIESTIEVSQGLSKASEVLRLLRFDTTTFNSDHLSGYLGQIQLLFLTSHEYTHLTHQHGGRKENIELALVGQTKLGSIDAQAEELNADGYAAYLVLAFLLRGARRQSALAELGWSHMPVADCNELIISCFFLAIMAFFSTLWPESIHLPFESATHPAAPVRLDHLIAVAKMWNGQVGCIDQSWFDSPRLQSLFQAAASVVDKTTQQTRDAQIALLKSPEGERYLALLFEKASTLRRGRVLPEAISS